MNDRTIQSKDLGDEVHEMLRNKLSGLPYEQWEYANVEICSQMLWQTVGYLAEAASRGDRSAIETLSFMMGICRESTYGNQIQTVEVEDTILG